MRKIRVAGVAACALSAVMMLSGFDSAMTPEDLNKKSQEAVAEKSNTTIKITMAADAKLVIGSDASTATTMPMNGNVDLQVAYTLDPFMMSMEGTLSGSAMGQSGDGSLKEYLVSNDDGTGTTYMYLDMSTGASGESEAAAPQWTAAKIDKETMDQVAEALEASQSGDYSKLKESGIDVEGIQKALYENAALAPEAVTVGDTECYEMTSELKGDQIASLLDQMMASGKLTQSETEMDETTKQLTEMVLQSLNIVAVTDYSTETFLPVHMGLDMSGSDFSWFGQLIAQSSASSGDSSSVPEVSVEIGKLEAAADYDYETPVEITVPDEAKNVPVQEAGQLESEIGTAIDGAETDMSGEAGAGDETGLTEGAGDSAGDGTPVPNADGSYTLTTQDAYDNDVTAAITVPDGYTASYQDDSYLGITDEGYNMISYAIYAFTKPEKMVEDATDVSVYQDSDEYTDVSATGPEEITLADGSKAQVVTVQYTFDGAKMGSVEAFVSKGVTTVKVTYDLYAGEGEELAVPKPEDMVPFCDGIVIAE